MINYVKQKNNIAINNKTFQVLHFIWLNIFFARIDLNRPQLQIIENLMTRNIYSIASNSDSRKERREIFQCSEFFSSKRHDSSKSLDNQWLSRLWKQDKRLVYKSGRGRVHRPVCAINWDLRRKSIPITCSFTVRTCDWTYSLLHFFICTFFSPVYLTHYYNVLNSERMERRKRNFAFHIFTLTLHRVTSCARLTPSPKCHIA